MKRQRSNSEKIIKWTKTIITSLLSIAIGLALGWLFSANYKWGIAIIVIISVASAICWVIIAYVERKFNILRMIQTDKKYKRNYEVIRFALGMSRPLFLAGRDYERMQIGQEALKAINDYQKDAILCGSSSISKQLLQARFYIEDCGWSLYASGIKNNIEKAKLNIETGLMICSTIAITDDNRDEVFTLIFRGLRHLLGIYLYSFSDGKLRELLEEDNLFEQYKNKINYHGQLLGFLLNDQTMYPSEATFEHFCEAFCQIVSGEQSNDLFKEFYSWMQERINNQDYKDEILIQSNEFKAQYFLEKFRLEYCESLKNQQTAHILTPQEKEYLNHARDNALILILISSESDLDISPLSSISSLKKSIDDYQPYIQRCPNAERLAKGYILLGTALMEQNTSGLLNNAKDFFQLGVSKSDEIDQISTYIQAQRKLITVLHRQYKLESNKWDSELKRDCIKNNLLTMKNIEMTTNNRIGYKDKGMASSLTEKRKFYRNELKSCK